MFKKQASSSGISFLFFSALTGAISLSYQTLLIKQLFTFLSESTIVTSIVISVYLIGMAIGYAISSRINIKKSSLAADSLRIVIWAHLLLASYALYVLGNESLTWWFMKLKYSIPFAAYAVIILYLFPVGFLSGVCFPPLTGAYLATVSSREQIQDDVFFHRPTGRMLFWDTAGSIFGCLICGVFLIPFFGHTFSLKMTTVVSVIIATLILIRFPFVLAKKFLIIAIILCVMILGGVVMPETSLTKKPEGHRFMLFEENSPYGVVRVFQSNAAKSLFINKRAMVSSGNVSERMLSWLVKQQAVKNFPIGSLNFLNIGLGAGLSAAELINEPRAKLTVSEINPVIVRAAAKHFKFENKGLLTGKYQDRFHLVVENGYDTLMRSPDHSWNAVVIDIEEPTIIYSSILYTREAMHLIRKKLASSGIVGVWCQGLFNDYAKVMVNTMREVFPYVTLRVIPENLSIAEWGGGGIEPYFHLSHFNSSETSLEGKEKVDYSIFLILASDQPLTFIDAQRFPHEQPLIDKILSSPVSEINTMDHMVLEKYFKINKMFELPESYSEEFYMKK